jgi:hypothetical protein
VPYLSNEQAQDLADDLRSVATFRYWIQDYRRSGRGWDQPPRFKKKLAKAPFRFSHPEPFALFAAHGWRVKHDIVAIDEGERLGRPFPIPYPWRLLAPLMSKAKWDRFREGAGYVLFQAGEPSK